jgi:hypothetical protein
MQHHWIVLYGEARRCCLHDHMYTMDLSLERSPLARGLPRKALAVLRLPFLAPHLHFPASSWLRLQWKISSRSWLVSQIVFTFHTEKAFNVF